MQSSVFFRLFPPPKFMVMKYAGLDISDDAMHCLEFRSTVHGQTIAKYGRLDIPAGLIDGGDIKDDKALIKLLSKFASDNRLSYVKVSIPEEKAYLFQTEIQSLDTRTIIQNIEFKFEENVPLPPADAMFSFNVMPTSVTGGMKRASVSVVPRAYIEKFIEILRSAGLIPVAFEVVPKAVAHAAVPRDATKAQLIVNIMNKKTGMYVASAGVVSFTSTISIVKDSSTPEARAAYVNQLSQEINRIYTYWTSHGNAAASIDQILLVGHDAILYENDLQNVIPDARVAIHVAQVWNNAFDLSSYLPPINRSDSLDFAVAAGLALP